MNINIGFVKERKDIHDKLIRAKGPTQNMQWQYMHMRTFLQQRRQARENEGYLLNLLVKCCTLRGKHEKVHGV